MRVVRAHSSQDTHAHVAHERRQKPTYLRRVHQIPRKASTLTNASTSSMCMVCGTGRPDVINTATAGYALKPQQQWSDQWHYQQQQMRDQQRQPQRSLFLATPQQQTVDLFSQVRRLRRLVRSR